MTEVLPRTRLFVALGLPADALEAVCAWQESVLPGFPGLRALPRESIHVTLCFLGRRPSDEVAEIAAACLSVAGSGAQRLALGAPIWLPPRRPSVLAVELLDAGGALGALQARLSSLLAGGGWYEPESRPYRPHLTVGRAQRRAKLQAVALPGPAKLSFACEELILYRSLLARGGARYEAIARVALAGGGVAG